MTELPQSFYDKNVRQSQSSRSHIWLAALLALVSGWTYFDLPGAPIHMLRLPEDVPSFGVGLADMFIDKDGTWVIKRQHYADRMNRYEIDPEGELHKWRGALRPDRNPEMEGGNVAKDNLMMVEGHTHKVRPSRRYHTQRAEFRRDHATGVPLRDDTAVLTPEQKVIEATARKTGMKEPYVIVMVYSDQDVAAHFVLQGHTYYEVIDSTHFRQPDLWLTTDRLKHLHRIRATDAGGKVVIEVLKSVPLDPAIKTEYDSKLGLDSRRGLLYLVLPTGEVYWFDPNTLEDKGHDKLPGLWEREYAQVGFTLGNDEYPGYPEGSGLALTERGYWNLMRALLVTFIASLIWLGLELIRAWKST